MVLALPWSRQLAPATGAKMFLGLHLRHPEQMREHFELVLPGQPGESWQGLRDKRHSLVRTVIAGQLIGSRPPIPDWGSTPLFTQGFFQKYASESRIMQKYSSKVRNLRRYSTTSWILSLSLRPLFQHHSI
jgi:hypothetical protein